MAGRIAVVDSVNRFVRWEERRRVHEELLTHRSVHILLFDRKGRLCIQQRHRSKQTHPLYWDLSCAGHVEESDYHGGPDDDLDQVYRSVAERELAEELGVTTQLERMAQVGPIPGVLYEWVHLFRGTSDGPLVPQEEEIEQVRWVARGELRSMAEGGALLTHFLRYLKPWEAESPWWG